MKNIFEELYVDLVEKGGLVLMECDAGGSAGGDAGGAAGGDAGGISSADVLGPDGSFENGKGCMGKGDFHVPFPVMPCLFRWPANWAGASQRKKKKGGKTVLAKNPYVKGMKTIIAETEKEAFDYQGSARDEFDEVVDGAPGALSGVLNYNRRLRLAWTIDGEDGLLHAFKPLEDGGKWIVAETKLNPDGGLELVRKYGPYGSENQALDAVWKEALAHQKKLDEMLRKVDESRFSPRDLMNWEAHGRDPRFFPRAKGPAVNARALQYELKRRFPHQFEDVEISDRAGRWTVEFETPLPDGQRRIVGQQRVATVIPQINRIISFLRTRGVEVNGYDVSARAAR